MKSYPKVSSHNMLLEFRLFVSWSSGVWTMYMIQTQKTTVWK